MHIFNLPLICIPMEMYTGLCYTTLSSPYLSHQIVNSSQAVPTFYSSQCLQYLAQCLTQYEFNKHVEYMHHLYTLFNQQKNKRKIIFRLLSREMSIPIISWCQDTLVQYFQGPICIKAHKILSASNPISSILETSPKQQVERSKWIHAQTRLQKYNGKNVEMA